MAEQPDGKTGDVFPRRRTVLAGLAAVPTVLLTHVQAGPLTVLLLEEFLSQCSTSITACWHLLNGDGLATVEYVLPTYLPLLVALARQPSSYQQRAAYLAAQGYLLMSLVSYHRLRFRDELAYAKQAVELAKMGGNRNLRIYALSRLGGAFELNGQPKAMLQARQEAEQYLDEEVVPPLRSHLFSALARAYALNGQVQDAIHYIGAAREPFPEQFGELPCFIAAHYGLHHIILFEGRTYLALGESDAEHVQQHSQQAGSALAQFGQLPSTIMVPERYRIQIINEQAAAAIGTGNIEEFEHYLLAGVEGAKALGSEKRRQEAIANYRAARGKWPHEARVRALAEVFLL
jgi:tetratricopeptide (TPR) repeat protein